MADTGGEGKAGIGDERDRIAAVAHELRTPLSGILALADILAANALPEQREHVEALKAAAQHLRTVASDLLDEERLKHAPLALQETPFNLDLLLNAIAVPCQARAAAQGITFRLEQETTMPVRVAGDAVRLRQMIENLLDNAFKVTKRGEICLRIETHNLTEDGLDLRISVADTGAGLSHDDLEHLFRPYAQGAQAVGGAGLGLSLVHRFAKAMGGRVFAEGRAEGGAIFGVHVRLKRAQEPATAPQNRRRESQGRSSYTGPERRKRLHILVAEDNPINRIVAGTILDQFGHQHSMVTDGAAAISAVQRGGVDLVLMDAKMPVMDGLTATTAIRGLHGMHGDIPVIAVTAHAFAHEVEAFRAAGADAVITKPLSVRSLWQAIEEVMQMRRKVMA